MQSFADLAIPAACVDILFLAYSSQPLFYYLEPGPLSGGELFCFNTLVIAIWWSYYRACTVDPAPRKQIESLVVHDEEQKRNSREHGAAEGLRWCKRCDTVKLPRAHHCKQCGRCIPKMDHHCPWTMNCVSRTTFPHFFRFILYAVISMSILACHILRRVLLLWGDRNLPAYLGPPVWATAHLFILLIVNSITVFAMSILLLRSVYSLFCNTTMIESWEIERHEVLLERAKEHDGYLYAYGGQKIRIEHQEFPYDIGFWQNICQGMGTSNPLMWFMPFAATPGMEGPLDYETNGFEDKSKTWPPPDPEKMPRPHTESTDHLIMDYETTTEGVEAFRRRQAEDYNRYSRRPAAGSGQGSQDYDSASEEGMDGGRGWTNSDGDRLRDYGVDEEAEAFADEDVPLGELLRRRKARAYA